MVWRCSSYCTVQYSCLDHIITLTLPRRSSDRGSTSAGCTYHTDPKSKVFHPNPPRSLHIHSRYRAVDANKLLTSSTRLPRETSRPLSFSATLPSPASRCFTRTCPLSTSSCPRMTATFAPSESLNCCSSFGLALAANSARMPAVHSWRAIRMRSSRSPSNSLPPDAIIYTSGWLFQSAPLLFWVCRALRMVKIQSTPKEIPTHGKGRRPYMPTKLSYRPPAAILPTWVGGLVLTGTTW